MKKITKKEIKECIRAVKKPPFDWHVCDFGVYSQDDNVYLYIGYTGQGINETVYNKTYDEIKEIDIDRIQEDTIKDSVNYVYELIQDTFYNN